MNLTSSSKTAQDAVPDRNVFAPVLNALSTVVLGKTDVIFDVMTSVLAGGHVLLEDVPGVGKTTLAQAVAQSLGLSFSRVQFTNDLLPSDIVGVQVYRQSDEQFTFVQDPSLPNWSWLMKSTARHLRLSRASWRP